VIHNATLVVWKMKDIISSRTLCIQMNQVTGNIVRSDAKLAVYVHHPYQMRSAARGI